jgi:hypothetical protein
MRDIIIRVWTEKNREVGKKGFIVWSMTKSTGHLRAKHVATEAELSRRRSSRELSAWPVVPSIRNFAFPSINAATTLAASAQQTAASIASSGNVG